MNERKITNGALAAKIKCGFDGVDEQFTRIDRPFTKIDEQFTKVDGRFNEMEKLFDERFHRIELRLDEHAHTALNSGIWKNALLL